MADQESKASLNRTDNSLVIVEAEKAIQQLPLGSKISLEVHRDESLHEKYKSVFLGYQPGVGLLFKMPCANKVKHSILLKENNVATIRGLSTQGTGAIIAFRATITRHYAPPYAMLLTTLPKQVQMHLLRNEPRFALDIQANISLGEETVIGGLEDISLSGCCFSFLDKHNFSLEDTLTVNMSDKAGLKEYQFTATVKNTRMNESVNYLGLTFSKASLTDVKIMLQDMILKGTKCL